MAPGWNQEDTLNLSPQQNVMNSSQDLIKGFVISVETLGPHTGSVLPGEEFHAEWPVLQQGAMAAFKDNIPSKGSFTASSHQSKHLHPQSILRSHFPERSATEIVVDRLIAIKSLMTNKGYSSIGYWHWFFIHVGYIPTCTVQVKPYKETQGIPVIAAVLFLTKTLWHQPVDSPNMPLL